MEAIRQTNFDGPLDKSKPYDGMTAMQWDYAYARARGLNITDAYCEVYDVSGSNMSTIYTNARDVEKDPQVRAKIQELVAAKYDQPSLVPFEVDRDWVKAGIVSMAVNTSIKDSTRLRAYELVGRMAGIDAFQNVVVHKTESRTQEDIDKELKAYLEDLKAKVIEGTSRESDSSDDEDLPRKDVIRSSLADGKRDRRRKPRS